MGATYSLRRDTCALVLVCKVPGTAAVSYSTLNTCEAECREAECRRAGVGMEWEASTCRQGTQRCV